MRDIFAKIKRKRTLLQVIEEDGFHVLELEGEIREIKTLMIQISLN